MPVPPVAEKRPRLTHIHGTELQDDYSWLRERGSREVLDYLRAENAYTEAVLEGTLDLRETLFREFKQRLKETDRSVPVQHGGFLYYSRTEEGKQYPIYCRKAGNLDNPEQVLLDGNRMAAGKRFFKLGAYEISPDHSLLAYSVDETGSERFTLRIRNLETGSDMEDQIPETYYSVAWANDNRSVFYTVLDAADRPYKVFRHELGSRPQDDVEVFHEGDERFHLGLSTTKSRRFVLAEIESRVTSEVHILDADHPDRGFRLFHPREQGVEYGVYHHGEEFFILTNKQAKNFRLMRTQVGKTAFEHWSEVLPHDPEVKLDGIDIFEDFLAIYHRKNGLRGILIRDLNRGEDHEVEFDEPVYTVSGAWNPEYTSRVLRFRYTSLVTPDSVYDYDMRSRQRVLRKRQEVLGGYDAGEYRSERVWATARDGRLIPVSLVYRAGLNKDGDNPCLLYGYGSYGISVDPRFSSSRISLLDRGFLYAIAHVRGGGELGREWYEDGKLLSKKNTFFDFIDAAEHLIAGGYTRPSRLGIEGGSAGGLLVGAVVNLRPDLFHAAHAAVPFVDVINTMLDETLPLTVIEYEEWGDPHEREFFEYMLSYSPYDNVEAKAYPHLLVTAGLNDPRVQYWEPAKWVAKLRALKTDDNWLLLKTEMGAGHGGPSGRYDALEQLALENAFFLERLTAPSRDR